MTSDLVLVESRSARDGKLSSTTHEQAENALSKAKALLHFAMYQGNKVATTEQVAKFYEVPEANVRQLTKSHKDEFESDGLKVLRGKALKDARDTGSLTSVDAKTSQVTTWTPRATLRLGMLLRDSEVAKAVRTGLLDEVESSGEKDAEMERLRMQVVIAQANAEMVKNERLLFERRAKVYEFNGETGLLVIDGKEPIVIEQSTLEVIDDKHKAYFKGQTLKQVVEYVKKRYGVRLKDGGVVKKLLKTAEKDSLIAHVPRVVVGEYIPQEHLDEVYKLLTDGSRQMLIGE